VDLKSALRGMTSMQGGDPDETYEAVLKDEFERMKRAFEKRIKGLQEDMKIQRR
jgi:hypothetical protein